ncbi:MAG: three-Cys-motif partner protein TcmP [Pseudomonadota bacterium]
MVTQRFGDEHTKKKLDTVEKYLSAFTTALKKQNFELLYIDACAGSGSSIPKSSTDKEKEEDSQVPLWQTKTPLVDTDKIIVGSAIRALGIAPHFDRYLFNDVKKSNVTALRQEVTSKFSHIEDRVKITSFDANEMLARICETTNWKSTRAVVFIDPFGLQITYETIQKLAATKAIDLWYLVPVFAMYRQIRGDGHVLEDGGPKVDAALGTSEWRNVVAVEQEGQIDLFGQSEKEQKRAVDIAWFEQTAKGRLSLAFDGRVVDKTLALGRNGLHEFSLMFAWDNPSEKAKLAAKLAKAVLK